MFVSGDSQEDVVVSIVDDAIPELDEMFCVSLILPEGGAVIGDIPEGTKDRKNRLLMAQLHLCCFDCVHAC